MLNLHKNVIKSVVVSLVVGLAFAGLLTLTTNLGAFPIVFFAWVTFEITTILSITAFNRGQ